MTDARRPFRFGVIGEGIRDGKQLLDTARRAEALGYSTLLLRDHFVAEPFGDQLAPLVALTAAAAATARLRVGTLVADNDYRHPVLLAKEAATLDHLSGGRLELGLGAGWLREEYERAGMPFDRAGTRITRLGESLRILKGLLSGQEVTAAGDHYTIGGLGTFPRPAQRPHLPILVGGAGRRVLELAGREADIVGFMTGMARPDGTLSNTLADRSPQALEQKIAWVRAAAGDRFPSIELSMVVTVTVTQDPRAAAEHRAAARGWSAAAAGAVLEMPGVLLGTVSRIIEEVLARRDRYGVTYYVVPDSDLETFAPVVEHLTRT